MFSLPLDEIDDERKYGNETKRCFQRVVFFWIILIMRFAGAGIHTGFDNFDFSILVFQEIFDFIHF